MTSSLFNFYVELNNGVGFIIYQTLESKYDDIQKRYFINVKPSKVTARNFFLCNQLSLRVHILKFHFVVSPSTAYLQNRVWAWELRISPSSKSPHRLYPSVSRDNVWLLLVKTLQSIYALQTIACTIFLLTTYPPSAILSLCSFSVSCHFS